MATNIKIPGNINQWKIENDQNEFFSNENWLLNAKKTEDILQLSHIYQNGLILDLGFYRNNFKIYVIYDYDWENPKEVYESKEAKLVTEKLYELIDIYANG